MSALFEYWKSLSGLFQFVYAIFILISLSIFGEFIVDLVKAIRNK